MIRYRVIIQTIESYILRKGVNIMKKKNKMKGMLKGVAAAGIVAGGASAIPEADVVFAAELEESEMGSESQVDVEYLESASESASEYVSDSASTVESESEMASDIASQTDASMSQSLSELESQSQAVFDSTAETFGQEDAETMMGVLSNLGEDEKAYQTDKGNILVYNETSDSYTIYYDHDVVDNSSENNYSVDSFVVDREVVTEDEDGSIYVDMSGYYTEDGIIKGATFVDYNVDSGNKVFINGNLVYEYENSYYEVLYHNKPIQYVGKTHNDNHVQILLDGEKAYLDGAYWDEDRYGNIIFRAPTRNWLIFGKWDFEGGAVYGSGVRYDRIANAEFKAVDDSYKTGTSELASQSESISDSRSASAASSASASTSASSSQSTSASAYASMSASLSGSTSASDSASAATSTEASTIASGSASASASASAVASDSASASASASTVASESATALLHH